MATKVTIDGKEYCVETLLHEVKRLKRELTIQAEANKQSKIGMLEELQLEIKELWDNRYDVWLDNQYYIGKSDTLEEVDEVIQQKIDKLKENSARGKTNNH